jgi:GTP-binding protein HflX
MMSGMLSGVPPPKNVRSSFSSTSVSDDLRRADRRESACWCARPVPKCAAVVQGRQPQLPMPRPMPARARWRRVAAELAAHAADLVIFNHELSAGQERNLERALQCRVIDRTSLILDIFAQRAQEFGGQAAGRTGPARTPGDTTGTWLDPPRATERAVSDCAVRARRSSKPTVACSVSASRTLKERLARLERQRGVQRKARGARRSCSTSRWWVTPMPASRPCSTP